MLQIKEKYFRIEFEGKTITLYFITPKGKEKLGGYFTDFYYALKRVCVVLKKNKLPYAEYVTLLKEYKSTSLKLDKLAKSVYNPILELDRKVNGITKTQSRARS